MNIRNFPYATRGIQGRMQDFGKGGPSVLFLGIQATKRGGSNFGPNVKKPKSWPQRGGPDPPPPPGSATGILISFNVDL